jgi:tetratricopeptide (TPR) repeat protein
MSLKHTRLATGLAMFLAAFLPYRVALALDESITSTARALAQQGEQDFKEGRFAQAGEKFLNAYHAVKVPTLARSAARAFIQQGKLVRASELYRQALLLQSNELWIGNVQQDAQSKAREELAALTPRLARLNFKVRGAPLAQVEVFVDDLRVPPSLLGVDQYVDPGERQLVVRHGSKVIQKSVTLAEVSNERWPSISGLIRNPQRASPNSRPNQWARAR